MNKTYNPARDAPHSELNVERGAPLLIRSILTGLCVGAASLLPPTTAHALAGISRACPFSELPALLKAPFAALAPAIGTASPWAFYGLTTATATEQARWWVLESLTIDWFAAKYWLYSENKAYYRDTVNINNAWLPFRVQKSGAGWTAERIPDSVLNDSTFAIFFANRQFLYSARAGNPVILERLNDPDSYRYRVDGSHYYYDPVSKTQGRLPNTIAVDCNLNSWGIEAR